MLNLTLNCLDHDFSEEDSANLSSNLHGDNFLVVLDQLDNVDIGGVLLFFPEDPFLFAEFFESVFGHVLLRKLSNFGLLFFNLHFGVLPVFENLLD